MPYSWKLKNSDLELTIVKGSSAQAPLNGPACTYVNLRVSVNNKEKGRSWTRSLQSANTSDRGYLMAQISLFIFNNHAWWFVLQREWCCWRTPEGITDWTWTNWGRFAVASLLIITLSSGSSVVELVRTVTPLKLLMVFSQWSRMVLDLFAVYTCTDVPERLGDNDRYLILIDKISDIALEMIFFFFLHVCILTTELTNKMDLQALNGKTLTVTQGSSSPGPAPTTNSLLCPYVNLLLCNAQPSGEKHTTFQYFRRMLQTNVLEI